MSYTDQFNTKIIGPTTAFGEVKTAHMQPQVQIKYPYGLNTDVGQALTNNASSTVVAGSGLATVTCAGVANSFSQVRTLDTVRYGAGQGTEFRGTCAFTTGVANSSQVFGCGDDDEGFFFGYNGTAFGILHRNAGELEIRSLTITAGADGDGGTFTITMDGTPVTVTVAAGDTIAEVCAKIVLLMDEFGDAGRGWEVHTDDNITIEFISFVAENAAGTFSFADVDSGVTAGTFTQATTTILGVAPTETWTAQADWNGDSVTIDQTKLNVYAIQFQYLGAGIIEYCIEDPLTGKFVIVHTILYANTAVIPSLQNPTLHLTLIAKTETGYSGGTLVMKTASMAGFIQGDETLFGVRHSSENTKAIASTALTNILTVHNELDYQGTKNKVSVFPDFLTLATDSPTGNPKAIIITIWQNPTEVSGTMSLTSVDTHSVMEYDTAGTLIVGGTALISFTIGVGDSKEIDLKKLNLLIRPGDRWSFSGSTTSGTVSLDVTVSLTWLERI